MALKTDSPFVFAKLNDQIREFHLTEGRKSAARLVKEFDVYNAGRWFYERVHKWSGGDACVHMLRKTVLQYARAGKDATQSLAKDARVREGVMMTHYVKEEDLQHRTASNAMFQRICLSMTPEVAGAFGHEHSGTAVLEQRLRDAIARGIGRWWVRSPRNLPNRIAKRAEPAFSRQIAEGFLPGTGAARSGSSSPTECRRSALMPVQI